jgi:DNA-binding IclR family transcriptional regulator
MSDDPGSRYHIQSAIVTVRIIDFLRENDGATLNELAEDLDRSKGSIHNYLSTLQEEGYINQEDSEYHLTFRFLELGGYVQQKEQVYDMAREEMTQLVRETGEVVSLMVEEDGEGVYIDVRRGADAVKMDMYPGYRVPLHQTALGKAILAAKSREEIKAIIDQHGLPATTDNTITDPEELFEELEAVRESDIAFDDQERIEGMRCVGTPIRRQGDVVAAISISAPVSRMQGERFRTRVPKMLTDSANIIQLNLTFS